MVGVDLTTVTAKPMRPATLNAQVAAALYLRCLASPNEAAKKEAIAMLRDTMRILQRETVADIRDMAWGVKEKVDESCFQRVPQDEISIHPSEDETKPETPIAELTKMLKRSPCTHDCGEGPNEVSSLALESFQASSVSNAGAHICA